MADQHEREVAAVAALCGGILHITDGQANTVDTNVSKFFDDLYNGIPYPKVNSQQQLFGPNFITIKVPSYFSLLIDEVLHPFYMFQLCSILLWSLDEYVFYAACIFTISLMSVL